MRMGNFVLATILGMGLTGCDREEIHVRRPVVGRMDSCRVPLKEQSIPLEGLEKLLVEVTTDVLPGRLFGVTAATDREGHVTSFRYRESTGWKLQFATAELKTGLVLYRDRGRNVITLFSDDFDPRSGGTIRMRYLYEANLIGSDTYREFRMELQRDGDRWVMYRNTSAGRRAFTKMFLAKHENWKGVVGIREVRVGN